MKKRLLPILLTILLSLSLTVPALAAVNYITAADGYVYTVSNDVLGEATLEYSYVDETTGEDVNVVAPLCYVPIGTLVVAPEGCTKLAIDIWTISDGTWQNDGTSITDSVCEIDTSDVVAGLAVYDEATGAVGQFIYYLGVESLPESPSSWAHDTVWAAIDLGFVPAELQTKYTAAITRGEFCALAVRLYETYTGEEIQARVEFPDTSDINVQKAAAINVLSGLANGDAAPDKALTRAQAASILVRLAEACGITLEDGEPDFNDNQNLPEWARSAVGKVQTNGIMVGNASGNFAPNDSYTREQSIFTIMSVYAKLK